MMKQAAYSSWIDDALSIYIYIYTYVKMFDIQGDITSSIYVWGENMVSNSSSSYCMHIQHPFGSKPLKNIEILRALWVYIVCVYSIFIGLESFKTCSSPWSLMCFLLCYAIWLDVMSVFIFIGVIKYTYIYIICVVLTRLILIGVLNLGAVCSIYTYIYIYI